MTDLTAAADDEGLSGLPVFDSEQRSIILRALLVKLLQRERYGQLTHHEPLVEPARRDRAYVLSALLVAGWPIAVCLGSVLDAGVVGWLALSLLSVTLVVLALAAIGSVFSENAGALVVVLLYLSGIVTVAVTGSSERLWWWFGAPLALVLVPAVLRGLRLGTVRDFAATTGAIARSAPLLAPVALVVFLCRSLHRIFGRQRATCNC